MPPFTCANLVGQFTIRILEENRHEPNIWFCDCHFPSFPTKYCIYQWYEFRIDRVKVLYKKSGNN
jgi:hypothetical protein